VSPGRAKSVLRHQGLYHHEVGTISFSNFFGFPIGDEVTSSSSRASWAARKGIHPPGHRKGGTGNLLYAKAIHSSRRMAGPTVCRPAATRLPVLHAPVRVDEKTTLPRSRPSRRHDDREAVRRPGLLFKGASRVLTTVDWFWTQPTPSRRIIREHWDKSSSEADDALSPWNTIYMNDEERRRGGTSRRIEAMY